MNGRPLILQGDDFSFQKSFSIFRPNGRLTSIE